MAKGRINGVVYLAMDFRWRAAVNFPNWCSVILRRSYASKETASDGVRYFAQRFGLRVEKIEVKDGILKAATS